MRHAIFAVLPVLLLAAPAWGQAQEPQVLYCVDEGITGFNWNDEGNAQSVPFIPERFTVKVFSKTRLVVDASGAGIWEYVCLNIEGLLNCRSDLGDLWQSYIFAPSGSYTRAQIYGTPVNAGTNDIWVAYGTCTKF